VKIKQHLVNKGETLEQIAKLYNTSIAELRKLNRLDGDLVKAGTLLTVPVLSNSNVSLNTQQTGMAYAANQSANAPLGATATPLPIKKGNSFGPIVKPYYTSSAELH
jgi:membrane-bound lytic murein transglycosylase D